VAVERRGSSSDDLKLPTLGTPAVISRTPLTAAKTRLMLTVVRTPIGPPTIKGA
jgi:hypothetical protein